MVAAMPDFRSRITGKLNAASSSALAFRVDADNQYRIEIEAGGKILWGPGGSTNTDTNLYRSAADTLKTDDSFQAVGGVITHTNDGAPSIAIADGGLAVDTTNNKFYFRSGGAWREVSSGAGSGGLPTGGATGTVLYKLSGSNYDAAWASSITITQVTNQTEFKLNLGTGSDTSIAKFVTSTDTSSSVYSKLVLTHNTSGIELYSSDTATGAFVNIDGGSTNPAYVNLSGLNPEYRVNGTVVTEVLTFTVSGSLFVGTGQARWYAPRAIKIKNVQVSVGTAPTGASLIFDVNINGTTAFSTQANRPTILATQNTDLSSVPNTTSVSSGQYITIDIDQVGSTVAGSDAVVQIEYYPV